MLIHYAILLFSAFKGISCVQFFVEDHALTCIYDFSNGNTKQPINETCLSSIFNDMLIDVNYILQQENMFVDGRQLSYIKLKGSFFADQENTITTYSYRSGERLKDFAVDWVHNTVYIILIQFLSGPIVRSNQVVPLNPVYKDKDVTSVSGFPLDKIDYTMVKVDPYRKYLFLLTASLETPEVFIIRSDLKGREMKKLNLNMSISIKFVIDIHESKLYVRQSRPRGNFIKVFNYEGQLLRQLSFPKMAQSFAVFEGSLYLHYRPSMPNVTNVIYEVHLNDTKQTPEVRNEYHITISAVNKLKIVDARVERQRKRGKYICLRDDCAELCEVRRSGDMCVCFKTKAKKMDDTMCYNCGVSDLTSLTVMPTIVDGKTSSSGDFPWNAVLYNSTDLEQICGGTLISSSVVITAAHCVTMPNETCNYACKPSEMRPEDLKVAIGKTTRSWNVTDRFEERRNVSRIVVHENFMGMSTNYDNDIALLFLDSEVAPDGFALPACLDYNFNNDLPPQANRTGYVYGFGYTKECGKFCSNRSDVLLYATGKAVHLSDCFQNIMGIERHASFTTLTPDKFCVGNGTVSPTQKGDSGGGFTFAPNGLHFLTGVVSVKVIRYDSDIGSFIYSFGGFTNVSMHMNWLKKKLSEID